MSPRLGFRSAMPWLSINPSLSAEIWSGPSLEKRKYKPKTTVYGPENHSTPATSHGHRVNSVICFCYPSSSMQFGLLDCHCPPVPVDSRRFAVPYRLGFKIPEIRPYPFTGRWAALIVQNDHKASVKLQILPDLDTIHLATGTVQPPGVVRLGLEP
ncbi:hypothetical protein B0H13DRAFT_1902254 [Mycena leptocephala]|nr:hypothetical protein B0H13DRAFT_1902254 [Mycena leptocephala]